MAEIGAGLLAKAGEGLIADIYAGIKKSAKTINQKFDWHTAQKQYCQKIEDDYGTTRILGKPEPVRLENIYTDVYTLDKITALQRFDITKLQNDPDAIKNKQIRQHGLELVKDGRLKRLYILGKPGAGKTTFLRYIALKASLGEIQRIPIFVSLKEWADSHKELMPFLVQQFEICRFPDSELLIKHILNTGQAIVLFDGLDEAQQEDGKRDVIISAIRNFSREFDQTQILITCRIAATDYTFDQFSYIELADFTDNQIELYVRNWFANNAEKIKQFKIEFNRAENKSLRELASTPLLLSLLCLNFDETGTFPSRRVEIYEEGINALLHKWDASRSVRRDEIYKGLSLGRKRQMFARIAAQTFEKNEYFLPKRKLVEMIVEYLRQLPGAPPKEDIDGDAVLKTIEAQHSIFVERAHEIYSFSHLTFQEYFAAKYVVENASRGTLRRLLTAENIIDQRWREVILNVASLLDEADSFFNVFQEATERFVAGDKSLTELIGLIAGKASSANIDEKIAAARIYHLYLNFDHLHQYSSINHLILPKVGILDQKFINTLDFAYILSRGTVVASANDTIRFLEKVKAVASFVANDFDDDFALDFKLIALQHLALAFSHYSNGFAAAQLNSTIAAFWQELQKESHQSVDNNFTKAINALTLPLDIFNGEEWKEFAERLLHLIQEHRKFGYLLYFSDKELEKVNAYFYANGFLLDCLHIAVVSDRQAIENRVLLLKQQASDASLELFE